MRVTYEDIKSNPEIRTYITPVSYTHLDVYKRQLIVLTAARRGSDPPHLVSIVYSVDYQGI